MKNKLKRGHIITMFLCVLTLAASFSNSAKAADSEMEYLDMEVANEVDELTVSEADGNAILEYAGAYPGTLKLDVSNTSTVLKFNLDNSMVRSTITPYSEVSENVIGKVYSVFLFGMYFDRGGNGELEISHETLGYAGVEFDYAYYTDPDTYGMLGNSESFWEETDKFFALDEELEIGRYIEEYEAQCQQWNEPAPDIYFIRYNYVADEILYGEYFDGWTGMFFIPEGKETVLNFTDGTIVTGWQSINGTWYYLNQDGSRATGWKNVDGTWYYFYSDGAMATGWINDGGTWYYLHGSGAMATGWINLGGTWYYLHESGAMATGWINDGGTWYYLHTSGAMAANQWIGNYYVNASGAWVN